MWRRVELDSLKSGYTIGTQIVKVLYRGYEAGMGGGWLYKCSPVLYTIRGIRWKPHRKKEKWRAVRVQYHYNDLINQLPAMLTAPSYWKCDYAIFE